MRKSDAKRAFAWLFGRGRQGCLQCAFLQNKARAMGNNVYSDGNFVWANSPDVGFGLNVSTVSTPGANPVRTNSWHGRVSQSTSEGLALGTGVGTLVATPLAAVRVGTGVVRGSQAVANAARAEAQLLQFGYYRWAVPAIPGVANIANHPQLPNAADFVLGGLGLDPNAPTTKWGQGGFLWNRFIHEPIVTWGKEK